MQKWGGVGRLGTRRGERHRRLPESAPNDTKYQWLEERRRVGLSLDRSARRDHRAFSWLSPREHGPGLVLRQVGT